MIPFIEDFIMKILDMFENWNENGYLLIAIIVLCIVLAYFIVRIFIY
jgi:hypothetical protein